MFAKLLSSLLLVLVAKSVISALVPQLQNNNIQLYPLDGNKYSLKVRHDDGSTLEQIVEKTAPGQYKVKGIINVLYSQPPPNPWITIGTDSNGNPIRIQQGPIRLPYAPPKLTLTNLRQPPDSSTTEED